MFATLLGGLPMPDGASGGRDLVEVAVRAQEAAGLEPITDGRLGAGGDPVAAWRIAAALTPRAVKQVLPGPYSRGWAAADGASSAMRRSRTIGAAEAIRSQVDALVAAGCPLIEIEETAAHRIGGDESERELFRDAHLRLLDGVTGTHLSLSIVGAAADAAGIETILAAPYRSLAVDLIEGPDNWRLVANVPQDRGIVVGALSARPIEEPKEVLLWGAHYAASTAGRGIDRVGLGSAGSWADLPWSEAVRRMHALGEAARLAVMPPSDELRRSLDPRAVSSRRAAIGHGPPPAGAPKDPPR
jgi:methionine synthase II (cobalamin-independent)